MERIFETHNAGYGQMVLDVARATKAKVSGVFTALKLPKPLVSLLTWGVLFSLGLMLAGLIVFVAFIYYMITNSGKTKADQLADEFQGEGRKEALARWEYQQHLGDTNDRF